LGISWTKNDKFKFLELDAKYGKNGSKNGFPDHKLVKNEYKHKF